MTRRHKEHGQKLKSAYDSLEAKMSDDLAIKEKDQDSKHEKTRQQHAKSLDELHNTLKDEVERLTNHHETKHKEPATPFLPLFKEAQPLHQILF